MSAGIDQRHISVIVDYITKRKPLLAKPETRADCANDAVIPRR